MGMGRYLCPYGIQLPNNGDRGSGYPCSKTP